MKKKQVVIRMPFYPNGPDSEPVLMRDEKFLRETLYNMRRAEIRPLSRQHAINTNADVDRTWLWNARPQFQAAFILEELEAKYPNYPKKDSNKLPRRLGQFSRDYTKQRFRRAPQFEEVQPEPEPEPVSSMESIRVEVHHYIHFA